MAVISAVGELRSRRWQMFKLNGNGCGRKERDSGHRGKEDPKLVSISTVEELKG